MSVREQIEADLKVAMRSKLGSIVTTLRGLKSEVQALEKITEGELHDSSVVRIVQKQIKRLDDSIGFAIKADRQDLVLQYKAEKTTLSSYLPEQLTEEQLKREIELILDTPGAGNIGTVMKELRSKFDGKFDGKLASSIVKKMLT